MFNLCAWNIYGEFQCQFSFTVNLHKFVVKNISLSRAANFTFTCLIFDDFHDLLLFCNGDMGLKFSEYIFLVLMRYIVEYLKIFQPSFFFQRLSAYRGLKPLWEGGERTHRNKEILFKNTWLQMKRLVTRGRSIIF